MKKWLLIVLLFNASNLFAFANAPIQRIDITNWLWNHVIGGNGGATKTSVKIVFENGGAVPCFTTILPFQSSLTVWAGLSQSCVAAITSVTFFPMDSSLGTVYLPPDNTIHLDASLYYAQLTVIQNTAPVFDSSNGSIASPGIAQVVSINKVL